MKPHQLKLLTCLASGEFRSGEALGGLLGVSRAAVWKQLQQLEALGLKVQSVKGRGYRIAGGLDLLQAPAVLAELSVSGRACLAGLQLESVVDSTNSCLMRQLSSGAALAGTACLAEQQTQGRGRRGRTWVSPFASNLYCSLAWEFAEGVAVLEGLSLAVGVAVVRALKRLNLEGIELKWPNDLLWHSRKLGGILVELSGEATGECRVVIGVGLNVRMPASEAMVIDQPWADIAEMAGEQAAPSRSRLAGVLLDELIAMLVQFQREGFTAFKSEWEACHAHHQQPVSLSWPGTTVYGRVLGITEGGALRLEVDGQEQVFQGGEISLRGKP